MGDWTKPGRTRRGKGFLGKGTNTKRNVPRREKLGKEGRGQWEEGGAVPWEAFFRAQKQQEPLEGFQGKNEYL